LISRRRVGVPGEQHQEEQDPGSTDRELCRPQGDASRDQARHHKLPTHRETKDQTRKALLSGDHRTTSTAGHATTTGSSTVESSFPLC
jgi:hypothetical protein